MEGVEQVDDMLTPVVSDTSDRTHRGQKPSLARCFVGVSDSAITSFSWLVIEIDTAKNSRAKSATNLVPTGRNHASSARGEDKHSRFLRFHRK